MAHDSTGQSTTPPAQRRRDRGNPLTPSGRGRPATGLIGFAVLAAVLLAASPLVDFTGDGSAAGEQPEVKDAMDRTVENGWGSATTGGSYTASHPRDSFVRDGKGFLTVETPGTSASAVLTEPEVLDGITRTTLSLDQLPTTGGGVYTSLILRRQANRDSYRAKYRVLPSGEVRLSFSRSGGGVEMPLGGERSAGITLAAGQELNVEAQVVGTDVVALQSRIWLGSAPGPWQHSVNDATAGRVDGAGSAGLMVYLSASSDAPTTVAFESLYARTPGAPEPSALAGAVAAGDAHSAQGGTASAGAVPLGSTSYPVPPDAIVASPAGDDEADGTLVAPVRTVARAISLAESGQTVVLRGGIYHETVTIPATKKLVLQSYPNEQVWFDGSSQVAGWVASGPTWVKTGWTAEFDSTPCYNAGRCATDDPAFQFVSRDYPMAAHPDQVWMDGEGLQQVASLEEVMPGTFFVDDAGDKLYLGSAPTNREVRASDLVEAIAVRSSGSIVRGIGVRRYATPLPKIATVKADAEDVTLENLVVSENATTGISATKPNNKLRSVTASDNGMLGILGNYADGLVVASVAAEGNNTEHFKAAPVAGGVKITRSREVQVLDGVFRDNGGTGVWFDESVYDITVTGNNVADNASHGLSLELSANALVADNLVVNNGRVGLKINNTNGVQVWNNTFVGNNRMIWAVHDDRTADDLSTPGHDPRQRLPDPTVTWLTGEVGVFNNIFTHPVSSSPCVFCVEDTTQERSAAEMSVVADGNVYNRADPDAPPGLVVWSRGAGAAEIFPSLMAFTEATGQGRRSWATDGAAYVAEDGRVTAISAAPETAARPLPADIAAKLAVPAGERHLGIWTH